MVRILVSSYSMLVEICLWLFFIGAAFGGARFFDGIGGLLIGLIFAFVFAILFVAPFLMIDDIRNRLTAIDRRSAESL